MSCLGFMWRSRKASREQASFKLVVILPYKSVEHVRSSLAEGNPAMSSLL